MDHSEHSLHGVDHSMHAMHATPTAEYHHEHDHDHDHNAMMKVMNSTTSLTSSHVHAGHDSHIQNGIHHMMSMAFHFGYDEVILFDWWKISTIGGLIASMAGIFLVALLYEGLKYYREYLFWKTYNLLEYRPVTGPQNNAEAARSPRSTPTNSGRVQYVGEVIHKQPPTMLSLSHIYQTFLHMVQVTVSFLLMLVFMTYNVWLCLAVILGAGVGYFLFCWKKSVIVDVTEHCH